MISGVRHYTDGDTPVPSVTTILSETGDKTALFEWRKRVGDAEANRISRESAGLGTKVHNALENYCNGEEWDTFGNNMVSVMAKSMTTEMIDKGMSNVDEVWGIEGGLDCSWHLRRHSRLCGLVQRCTQHYRLQNC